MKENELLDVKQKKKKKDFVDGLFTYHIVGWKWIPLNWVGGKLYLLVITKHCCKVFVGLGPIVLPWREGEALKRTRVSFFEE